MGTVTFAGSQSVQMTCVYEIEWEPVPIVPEHPIPGREGSILQTIGSLARILVFKGIAIGATQIGNLVTLDTVRQNQGTTSITLTATYGGVTTFFTGSWYITAGPKATMEAGYDAAKGYVPWTVTLKRLSAT